MATKVTVRGSTISRGRKSLYLEFYPPIRDPETMKMIYKDVLGMYIFQNPKNDLEKQYNKEMLEKAEGIRAIRVHSLINEDYGFLDKRKQKLDFLEYYYQKTLKKNAKWLSIYKHFEIFVNGKCLFGDVTVQLCERFRDYLISAKQLNHPDKKLSQNSAAGYYSSFRGLLKIAYKERYLKENLNDFLDRIETKETKKEFLIFEELEQLAKTPCHHLHLKEASIFSCLTGLRISDILKLKWEDITPASDGGYWMRIKLEKGQKEVTLPVSEKVLKWCGDKTEGKVFKHLTKSMTNVPLKAWIASAGITKHITFHCFRHTFATLQLAAGTDIFVVKEMLAHEHVTTTEIYAKLVNSKKRESSSKIIDKINI